MSGTGAQTVLFVDDAPDEARLYAEYVGRKTDLAPMTALSAEEAFETLAESDVDCLVSDSVQTADGTPLVEAVKSAKPELPVLLYSGRPPADLPTDVVDEYLRKGASSNTSDALETLSQTVHDLVATSNERSTAPGPGPAQAWQYLGTFDWTAVESVSVEIVQALARRSEFDPSDAAPIYETVDPESLDALITDAASSAATSDVVVRFPVDEYVVRVVSNGVVEYRERDRFERETLPEFLQ